MSSFLNKSCHQTGVRSQFSTGMRRANMRSSWVQVAALLWAEVSFRSHGITLTSPPTAVSVKNKMRIWLGPEINAHHKWLCWLLTCWSCTNWKEPIPGVVVHSAVAFTPQKHDKNPLLSIFYILLKMLAYKIYYSDVVLWWILLSNQQLHVMRWTTVLSAVTGWKQACILAISCGIIFEKGKLLLLVRIARNLHRMKIRWVLCPKNNVREQMVSCSKVQSVCK